MFRFEYKNIQVKRLEIPALIFAQSRVKLTIIAGSIKLIVIEGRTGLPSGTSSGAWEG